MGELINKTNVPYLDKSERLSFIQRVIAFLRKVFINNKANFTNEEIASLASSEEEKQAILDGCEDIDNYYGELQIIQESTVEPEKYLIERLVELASDNGENSNSDEIKEALNKRLDEELKSTAKNFVENEQSENSEETTEESWEK